MAFASPLTFGKFDNFYLLIAILAFYSSSIFFSASSLIFCRCSGFCSLSKFSCFLVYSLIFAYNFCFSFKIYFQSSASITSLKAFVSFDLPSCRKIKLYSSSKPCSTSLSFWYSAVIFFIYRYSKSVSYFIRAMFLFRIY